MKYERIPLAERLKSQGRLKTVCTMPASYLALDEYLDAAAQLTGNGDYRELFFFLEQYCTHNVLFENFFLYKFVNWAWSLPEEDREEILTCLLISPFAEIYQKEHKGECKP